MKERKTIKINSNLPKSLVIGLVLGILSPFLSYVAYMIFIWIR